jgi:hypothetical protein
MVAGERSAIGRGLGEGQDKSGPQARTRLAREEYSRTQNRQDDDADGYKHRDRKNSKKKNKREKWDHVQSRK